MKTVDTGDELFNPDIWHSSITKPDDEHLGLNFRDINVNQIPFDHRFLEKGSIIENEFGDALYYTGESYHLITNDCTRYLANWFCKWKNKSREIENNEKGFSHFDYMELALRVCDVKIDKRLISLILRLDEEKPLEKLSIKDIIKIRMENDKDFENEQYL